MMFLKSPPQTSQRSLYLLWAWGKDGILAPSHHPARRLRHQRGTLWSALRSRDGGGGQAQGSIQVGHGRLNLLEAPEPHLPHTLWTSYQGELHGFQQRTMWEKKTEWVFSEGNTAKGLNMMICEYASSHQTNLWVVQWPGDHLLSGPLSSSLRT